MTAPNTLGEKQCAACAKSKSRDVDFYRDPKSADGLQALCKPCFNARRKPKRTRHASPKTPEEAAAREAERKQKAREYNKRWREKNPGAQAAYNRRWREKNPDAHVAYNRRWRANNPDAQTAYNRRWREQNPGKYRAWSIANGAQSRGIPCTLTPEWIASVVMEPCYYCGDASVPPDSINGLDRIDSSLGYSEDNVVVCCRACNLAKSDMSTAAYYAFVQRLHAHMTQKGWKPPTPASPPDDKNPRVADTPEPVPNT